MTGIQDKVVVVTGGSSGLGEATAKLLAERGAKVVRPALAVRRTCRRSPSEIENDGGAAAYRVTNVTDRDQVATW